MHFLVICYKILLLKRYKIALYENLFDENIGIFDLIWLKFWF
jgi:hypothetical protein